MTEEPRPLKYLGIDIETTGLDPARCRILEIAAIALDEDLREVACVEAQVRVPLYALQTMDTFVVEMHTKNGLIEHEDLLVKQAGLACELEAWPDVVDRICGLISMFPKPPPMLGHSIGAFDRPWLTYHAPEVIAMMSHRNVDARSFVELCPALEDPEGEKPHRALADIRHSADVCRQAKQWLKYGEKCFHDAPKP